MMNIRKSRIFNGPQNTKSNETDIFKMLKPSISMPVLKNMTTQPSEDQKVEVVENNLLPPL